MKIILYFIVMITCTVVANLLLKNGASSIPVVERSFIFSLFTPKIILGLSAFALGALFFILLLQRLPLNIVQSFAAIQYVAVILGAAFILSEPIPAKRWVGIFFIVLGIFFVGWSQSSSQ